MNIQEIKTKIESKGNESYIKRFRKLGYDGELYGLKVSDLRALASEIGYEQEIGALLWKEENLDLRYLACMVMDPKAMSPEEVASKIDEANFLPLLDEYTNRIVLMYPDMNDIIEQCKKNPNIYRERVQWRIYAQQAKRRYFDDHQIQLFFDEIKKDMKDAPKAKQETMNWLLVEIGIAYEEYRQTCIEIAEKIGKLDDRPIPKGCTSSYAPEWIAAVVRRKKKSIRQLL